MKNGSSYLLIGVAAAATAMVSAANAGGDAGKLELRDVGAKFVGYTTKSADNGSVDVLNPLFVQYLLPERKRHNYPVVFIHGGGGQGTDWLETPDGSSRMMLKTRRAGSVVAPGWSTCASQLPRTPTSRSVVVRCNSVSSACSKTLERMGRVVRVLTTFCTCCRASSSFSLVTLNFMVTSKQPKM